MRYTEERNVQMIIYLMKQYRIKNVIACPGAGNITLIASLQSDPFFIIRSVVDERSAVYMACGLAQETGAPVAVSVTNNVAIRNTVPGMTEAYYRNLPILLLSSAFNFNNRENYWPQFLDERAQMNDAQRLTVEIPLVNNAEDEWAVGVNLNRAFHQLTHWNGGPVHIHYQTQLNKNYIEGEVPEIKRVQCIYEDETFPDVCDRKIIIYVGNHKQWTEGLTREVERFCELYDAMVFCDNTSNYMGKYRIRPAILWNQQNICVVEKQFDVVIHIGNPSGSYVIPRAKEVWRVDVSGEVRDSFMQLKYVFSMEEIKFFRRYNELKKSNESDMKLYKRYRNMIDELRENVPELPFSNAYIAHQSSKLLPSGSAVYFAILNTLRCWNLFELPEKVSGYSNTGAFGIDGGLSTLIGMSFANPDKLYFGIFGDLGFFFDMNALGNRNLGRNLRILVVNNGVGAEFKTYKHFAENLGDEVDSYIAAAGHFSSKELLKHYAEDLGMEYVSASTKEEFMMVYKRFFTDKIGEKSILFEVFTNSSDEKEALKRIYNIL